jgi:SAM-dependent methyltransferase
MTPDVMPHIRRCPSCGYFASDFSVAINVNREALDEDRRIDALAPIRQENFTVMLDRLAKAEGFPSKAGALDVGCGHGWFLHTLKTGGHRALGIEPDAYIADIARGNGHEVIAGYFPAALPADARFDVIFFNDVFEHLSDVNGVVEDVKRHTTDNGWVVVNLPVSNGIFFQIGRALARLGWRGPFRRLWQEGMPSPHLSYFSGKNIVRLFARHGFALIASGALRSVSHTGLFDRIRYDRNIHPKVAYLYFAAAWSMVPVLALLPADIRFFAFRKASRR